MPDDPSTRMLKQILEEERHVPQKNVNILLIMFVVVLLVNLAKGGGAFRSPLGITCGSSMFWNRSSSSRQKSAFRQRNASALSLVVG